MATYTPNLNLYKPDANDPFGEFREKFNDNMDILDNGGGGHTIYDENGSAMTQRAGLEFTGSVSVSDDSVNDKTIVDILGGNVYGAFIDTDRVIKATTTISGETTVTYTATEDCVVTFTGVSDYEKACEVKIDNVRVWRNYNANNAGGTEANSTNLFLRKGQVISASNGSSQYNGNYTVYGIKQGSNGIFAPVIYSDTERKIGVYKDGKPLYVRTFTQTFNNIASGSAQNMADISGINIETVVDIFGCVNYYNGANWFNANLGTYFNVYAYTNGYLQFLQTMTGQTTDRTYKVIATLYYTKTTDTAGSGDWTTDGTPTVHYSTNERVIGTWVDGKPVYEISLDLNSMNIDRNMFFNTGILLSSHNIKSFVSDGTLIDNQTIRQAFPCCMVSMAGNTTIGVGVNWFGSADTRTFDYLIFRFTKTTD